MELAGFEPATSSLQGKLSPIEIQPHKTLLIEEFIWYNTSIDELKRQQSKIYLIFSRKPNCSRESMYTIGVLKADPLE